MGQKLLLKAEGISAGYEKRQILKNISFTVNKGDKTLIIGPNGAGKSTLLKVIGGLHPCSGGNINFDDHNITGKSPHERVSLGMGYLLQAKNIVPGLTVEENLQLGGYPLKGVQLMERLEELLSLGLLTGKRKKRAGLLSGGERQTLAICMVLIKHPRLLLLDEPSASLSPKAVSVIMDLISTAQEQLGIESVCMVEHNLGLSLKWANRLVALTGGKLKCTSGSPTDYIEKSSELEKFFLGNNS